MEHDSHDLDNGSCSAGIGACENACLWKRSFVSLQEVSGGKTWRKPIETSSTVNGTRQTPPPLDTLVFCPFLSKVLLRHLLSSSLLPTLITLNTAVLTCAQVARWQGALEITSALKLVYNEHLCFCSNLELPDLTKFERKLHFGIQGKMQLWLLTEVLTMQFSHLSATLDNGDMRPPWQTTWSHPFTCQMI